MKILRLGRYIFNNGTKAELEEKNLILLDGEIAIEQDTQLMKIGDGQSLYSDLPYLNRGPRGFKGDKGDKGDTGAALSLNGTVPSTDKLPKNPKDGEAYMVAGDLYVAKGGAYTNYGKIKGPQGERGPQGIKGERGPQGIKGERGDIGPQGFKGERGEVGPQGFKGEKGDPLKFEDLKEEQKKDIANKVTVGEILKDYVKPGEVDDKILKSLKSAKLSDFQDDSSHRIVTDEDINKWNKKFGEDEVNNLIEERIKREAIKPLVMTAVIDQTNSNPLSCISYEDDARKMEKGSAEWDKFFKTKLVLFKDGKEVRDLEDKELNNLKLEDGDVMVKFRRLGLNIKAVEDKIYITMTDNPDDPNFKYYAHTRGTTRKEAFYLGAYLGFLDGNKLRSVTNKNPQDSKSITDFRTYAQANGSGYDLCGFYQLTFLQAMYVLKYGNLDSQTALGKGLTTGGQNFANTTGSTNGKGTDYGTTNSSQQMRFQFIEDFYGNRMWAIDGVATDARCAIYTAKDNFNNSRSGYTNTGVTGPNSEGWTSKVYGTTELGFLSKEFTGSSSTFYADYSTLRANYFLFFGGYTYSSAQTGSFSLYLYPNASDAVWSFSARLMYL